jgi:hypothetical protein
MGRTNNMHARNPHQTWAKRHCNKVACVSSRQRVKELNVSALHQRKMRTAASRPSKRRLSSGEVTAALSTLEASSADQLEERGAVEAGDPEESTRLLVTR